MATRFRFFSGGTIYDLLRERAQQIEEAVRKIGDDTLLGTDVTALTVNLAGQLRFRPPVLRFDNRTRRAVPAGTVPRSDLPNGVVPNRLHEYVVPVEGEVRLLQYRPANSPTRGISALPYGYILSAGIAGEVAFYLPDFDDSDMLVQQATTAVEDLKYNGGLLIAEINSANGSIQGIVQNAIAQEKARRHWVAQREQDLDARMP